MDRAAEPGGDHRQVAGVHGDHVAVDIRDEARAGLPVDFPWSQRVFANQAATDRPVIGCIGVGSMGTGDAKTCLEKVPNFVEQVMTR